jgi:ComF family protein
MPITETLISTLAPFDCLVCQQEGELLCADCRASAIITKRPTCYRCNKLSAYGKTCANCRRHSALAGVLVASHYDGVIKELVHHIKYDYARAASSSAAALLTPLVDASQFDLITCVPAAPARLRQRGFNQAKLIAQSLAQSTRLPYADLLLRTKNVHQVGLTRAERLEQVQGIFVAHRPELIKGARVLIVDDVITTGATVAECAKMLQAAGAKSVWAVAVAKH